MLLENGCPSFGDYRDHPWFSRKLIRVYQGIHIGKQIIKRRIMKSTGLGSLSSTQEGPLKLGMENFSFQFIYLLGSLQISKAFSDPWDFMFVN